MFDRLSLPKKAVLLLGLTGLYFAAGKLGLSLAIVNPSASAVWPPTGIALTALLWFGPRVWPAIFVGAFFVNLTTAGTVMTSLAIAMGNTLEGIVGSYLVNRYANGLNAFERSEDVFRYVFLAALLSTIASATIGVGVLIASGLASPAHALPIWFTWWQGDAMGALLLAPLLILWIDHPHLGWSRRQFLEALFLASAIILLALVGFCDWYHAPRVSNTLRIFCIPVVIWAAFRFGPREAATTSALLCTAALWGTLHGIGPFNPDNSPNDALLRLQLFMGVVTLMGISIGVEVRQRKRAAGALSQVNETLERRVEERTSSLTEVVGALKNEIYAHTEAQSKLKLYRDIVSNIQIGIVVLRLENREDDRSLRFVAINEAAVRAAGADFRDALGTVLTQSFPALYQTPLPKMFADVVRTGQNREVPEIRYGDDRIPDGFFSIKVFPLPDQCIGVAFENISERKHMEESLRSSEERFHLMIENIKDYAIYLLDPDGHVQSWNTGAQRIKGYPAEEIIGQHFSRFYPEEDVQSGKPAQTLKEAIAKGSSENEGWRVRKDGSRFWANVVTTPLYDKTGRLRGFAKITRDITERRKAEEAIRASEERFRRILSSNIIGFMTVDKQGNVLEANDAFLDALGYSQEDLAAGRVGGPNMTPPEYATMDEWSLTRLQDSGYCPPFEKEYIRRDGTRWPVLVGAVRLDEPEPRYVSFVIDVTERRRAQNALQKSYDELEKRVNERTVELTKANTDLENEITLRKKAEEDLRNLSLRDPLTGLYNRRGFLALADQHLLQAARDKNEFLLFFADLDGLKEINDHLGHSRGDQALIKAADALRETFRKSDILARVGGDEFAIVATEAKPEHRKIYLARLRETLDRLNAEGNFPFLVSLSIGAVVFNPKEISTVQELMSLADQDLYRSKRSRHQRGVKVIRAA